MRKLLTLSSLALSATMLLAAPAFAQEERPVDEIAVSNTPRGGWRTPEGATIPVDLRAQTSSDGETLSAGLDDEVWVACLRLPTLADLSKERWNETHRRFDGRRGRPIKTA